MRTATTIAWIVGAAACGNVRNEAQDGGPKDTGVEPDAGDGRQTVAEFPVTLNRNLDLLFVVDDSGSMADKQANLAANFPNFINQLASRIPGGLPDLHLGVVTTDMGTKGTAVAEPGLPIGQPGQGGCMERGKNGVLQLGQAGSSVQNNFISDIKQADGSRQKNYTGELATVFGNMAKVGSGGCGFEQPLQAMRAALNNNPSNVGFLRPDALLAVFFVGDEDDCTIKDPALFGPESPTLGPLLSFRCTRFGVTCDTGGTTPDEMNTLGPKSGCHDNKSSDVADQVQPYHDFLLGLKAGDRRRVMVGGIIAPPVPVVIEDRMINGTTTRALAHSCTYQGATGPEVGDPGVRFKSFFDLFPDRNTFATVCTQDQSDALAQLGSLVAQSIGTPCIDATIADGDPNMPGTQYDCIVSETSNGSSMDLAACSPTAAKPCWRIDTDVANCPSAANLTLVIDRAVAPAPDTIVRARCKVE